MIHVLHQVVFMVLANQVVWVGGIGEKVWKTTLRAHLDQVPLNYPSETVVQPSSTAHFHYGLPTVEPLSW